MTDAALVRWSATSQPYNHIDTPLLAVPMLAVNCHKRRQGGRREENHREKGEREDLSKH